MRAIGLLVLVAACGGDGGGGDGTTPSGFDRACDESDIDGDCIAYTGEDWTEDDVVGYCSAGILLPSCPDEAAVGLCTVDGGTGFETVTTFYSGYWSGNSALTACNGQGGTFEQP